MRNIEREEAKIYTGKFQKETLVAETEPENVASGRVLEKAGFEKWELVVNAFEVEDLVTGEKGWRDAVPWKMGRPSKCVQGRGAAN